MLDFAYFLKKTGEIGYVESIYGDLVYASGLAGAKIGEMVLFEKGQKGIVKSILAETTEILLLDIDKVDLGVMAVRSGEDLYITISSESLGRIVNPFGLPLDAKGEIKNSKSQPLEQETLPLIDRVKINKSLETGVTIIDLLIPIGRGQRELVIGDPKTGKTNFLLQTIARQAQLGTICIYTSIGKKKSDLVTTSEKLEKFGAMKNIVIIAASSSTPVSLIYLAPFSAFSMAQYFSTLGRDVLVVLDDISAHARAYRELSLLSKKMPGRDSYPGDIFHLHATLMEKAGKFKIPSKSKGQETASITCLPVVETSSGDFAGYIETNIMSMTDGHIFFDLNRFQQGARPAVNTGLSVTRVGKQTQTPLERDYARKLKAILFSYTKAQNVAKFGVELHASTQQTVVLGEKLTTIFDQTTTAIIPKFIQFLYIELLLSGFWQESTLGEIKSGKDSILQAYNMGKIKKLTQELTASLEVSSQKLFTSTVAKYRKEIAAICAPTSK